MNLQIQNNKFFIKSSTCLFVTSVFYLAIICAFFSINAFAQDNVKPQTNTQDKIGDQMIDQFIDSLGLSNPIVFDANNIKQYWTDNTVYSKDGIIYIMQSNAKESSYESIPLQLMLANVNETLDCTVTVLSEDDISFDIIDTDLKQMSSASAQQKFIDYNVLTSKFHLEKTKGFIFNIVFNSKTKTIVEIKKIILSFSNNKDSNYLVSPNSLQITKENAVIRSTELISETEFILKGIKTQVYCPKNLLVSEKPFELSTKVKNIGDSETKIQIGYAVYNKKHEKIDTRNYPYKNTTKALKVISCEKGKATIEVDSYSEWAKNSMIALNANVDLSDVPNFSFLKRKIVDFTKMDNGHGLITFDQPIENELHEGDFIRIHGAGGVNLYTRVINLKPGEEDISSSTIALDKNYHLYSSKAFSEGVYYVIPLILSYSVDPEKENTISIGEFSVIY